MLEKWTGEVVGTMHIYGISFHELAAKAGITNRYLSALINGHRCTADSETRIRAALTELIEERACNGTL